MSTRIARQLLEFARQRRAAEQVSTGHPHEVPRAAVAALALLPFRRLFTGAGVSSRIKDFVYTLS
jgi:hypothetical protein